MVANPNKSKDKKGPSINYKKQIVQTNKILGQLKADLGAIAPKFHSGMDVRNITVCHDALVSHRLVKKFSPPGVDTRQVCFDNYIAYDKSLASFEDLTLWGPTREHFLLRKVRQLIHRWCKGRFKFHTFQALDLDFTPGETFNSTQGDVSMIGKLFNLKHWTVTHGTYELAQEMIYNHPTLKYIARKHIGHVSKELRNQLYSMYKDHPCPGFAVFCWLLEDRNVLIATGGSRASSVFKNIDTDRMINVEAFFTCMLQREFAGESRTILRINGNSLDPIGNFDAQELHKLLISRSCYATIDFSNASDSVLLRVCELLFPANVYSWLQQLRSPCVRFGKTEWYTPRKLSSMGNGFTFEVMSMILYAISCVVSKHPSRVFGDDVIIHNDDAHDFIRLAALIGFHTNETKTFINSPFRESCGAFYHDDGCKYLVSYEFKWCEVFADVCISHNKLKHISMQETLSDEVRALFSEAAKGINSICLASQKGQTPHPRYFETNLSLYVWSDNATSLHKKDTRCRDRFVKTINRHKAKLDELQLYGFITDKKHQMGVTVTSVPVYVASKLRTQEYENYVTALYAGKRVPRTVTGRGRWVNIPAFVFPDGYVMPVRCLRDRRVLKSQNRNQRTQIT